MTFSRLRFLLPIAVLSLLSSSVFSQSECEIPGLFTLSFSCSNSVSFDGYDYATVEIGDQCWFQENLRSEHYLNGDLIPGNQDGSDWSTTAIGLQTYYDNDASNLAAYGRLYNWYAVDDARGLCPSGWHVPTDDEWTTLELHLGMDPSEVDNASWRGNAQNLGGQLKEQGTDHWNSPNTGADNSSGFTGLGSGYRSSGSFSNVRNFGYFWSSSPSGGNAWFRLLGYSSAGVARPSYYSQRDGFAVRCALDFTDD